MNLTTIYNIFQANGIEGVLKALSLEGVRNDMRDNIQTLSLGEAPQLGVSKNEAEATALGAIELQISQLNRK